MSISMPAQITEDMLETHETLDPEDVGMYYILVDGSIEIMESLEQAWDMYHDLTIAKMTRSVPRFDDID